MNPWEVVAVLCLLAIIIITALPENQQDRDRFDWWDL